MPSLSGWHFFTGQPVQAGQDLSHASDLRWELPALPLAAGAFWQSAKSGRGPIVLVCG